MITSINSNNQLRITKQWRDRFAESHKRISERTDLHPVEKRAYLDSYQSQIEDLNELIREYEDRQS